MTKHIPMILALIAVSAIALPDLLPDSRSETGMTALTSQPEKQQVKIVAWRERPLFHRSRKPFAGAGNDTAPQTAGRAGNFGERFEIKGFGRANGTVLAILVDKSSEEAHRVRLGDEIEGWTFASENDGAVTFNSSDGRRVTLTLARLP
jgi:hypothetical protein